MTRLLKAALTRTPVCDVKIGTGNAISNNFDKIQIYYAAISLLPICARKGGLILYFSN